MSEIIAGFTPKEYSLLYLSIRSMIKDHFHELDFMGMEYTKLKWKLEDIAKLSGLEVIDIWRQEVSDHE